MMMAVFGSDRIWLRIRTTLMDLSIAYAPSTEDPEAPLSRSPAISSRIRVSAWMFFIR